jgi:hypothetical protein
MQRQVSHGFNRPNHRGCALDYTTITNTHPQVSAERKKRASVLESEGQREAAINVADGSKSSVILASEVLTIPALSLSVNIVCAE